MSKYQGFSSIALIIIAVLILGGGYAVWKNQAPAPTPTPTDTNIEPPTPPSTSLGTGNLDISNWKTYRNDKYGFEFKYPPYLSSESIGQKITAVNLGDYYNPVYGLSVGKGTNFVVIDTPLLGSEAKKVINFSSPTGRINGDSLSISYVDLTKSGGSPIYYAFINGPQLDFFVEFYPGQTGGLKGVDDMNKLLSTFRFTK